MTTSFTKKQIGLAISCALALSVVSGAARAETFNTEVGYAVDPQNRVVWNSSGGCWRTGTGPAETPRSECGGTMPVAAPVSKAVEPAPRPVARAAVAPEPAPQPAPAPVVVVAPKPPIEHVTLNADVLFDFNKSALRPAGRKALDDFVASTVGIDLEMITVIGHTDRLGSEAYNQKLSERRAEAVKDYLVSKGIGSDRVQAEGRGETQPATKAGECKGPKSAKVIACLQPDRSVEIEVMGSRTPDR